MSPLFGLGPIARSELACVYVQPQSKDVRHATWRPDAKNARRCWLCPTWPTCPPVFGKAHNAGLDGDDRYTNGRRVFFILPVLFLVGQPGHPGPAQQNQGLLASSLAPRAWTGWHGLRNSPPNRQLPLMSTNVHQCLEQRVSPFHSSPSASESSYGFKCLGLYEMRRMRKFRTTIGG